MRVLLFVLLLTTQTKTHILGSFPKKYVVTQNESSHVKIHCDTTSPGPVTWKFNGADLEQVDFAYHQEQLDLMVEEVDQPMLGEYSCWRNGVQLSSTHLLEEDVVNDEHFKSFLRCWAKSYDCHFSCEWNHSVYSTVRLGLGSNCSQGLTSCQWVQSSHRTLKGKLHFDIAHHLTPFAEETDVLTLTVEAFADHYSYYSTILRKTRHFFLRDIIQPDSPDIVKCEEEGIALNVTIEPPSSWSRPHSFFQLEHEIEYVSRDNGEHGTTTSILIPQGVSRLRVRSRDPLVMSRWSHWSKWKNIHTGNKRQCRCMNKNRFCCPELTPKVIHRCQMKQEKSTGSLRNVTKTSSCDTTS